jgi:predicted Rossmann-fold nucleotide-binding protein
MIVIGGGAGTLSEIALGWIYRRLIVALPHAGWSAKLAGTRIDQRVRYKDIPGDRVYEASTASDAVELVAKLLPKYQRRHVGIGPRK